MAPRELTERQRAVRSMVEDDGMTAREVAEALGISVQGAHDHIRRLEKRLGRKLKRKVRR